MGSAMNQSTLKSEQGSRIVLKPIIFSLLTLFSGIVIGIGLTLISTNASNGPKTLPPGPEYMSKRMVQRIVHELKLSPEQHQQLDPIVQKHIKAMDDIRKQARPQINKELEQMNEEILSILNEQQKNIWKDRIQRMRDHFLRMRQHRGPRRNPKNGRTPNVEPDQPFDGRIDQPEQPPDMAPPPEDY